MQVGQKPRNVGGIDNRHHDMSAAGAGECFAGFPVAQAAAGGGALDAGNSFEPGQDFAERAKQIASAFLYPALSDRRHTLGVEIQQHKARLTLIEGEIVKRPGNESGIFRLR